MMGLILLPLMTFASVHGGDSMNDRQRTGIAPARDGNIAIQEELTAARRAATVAAYDLFIARHPQHPLAEVARRERAELARSKPR